MALSYASPGVYVEEVDKGTKPIEAVGTSTAAFIGMTAEASRAYMMELLERMRSLGDGKTATS